MARILAKSIPAAEKRALAGENDSQDSQELLMKHMLKHGVGVQSSSPAPMGPIYQSKRSASPEPTKANPQPLLEGSEDGAKQPQNASNALVQLNTIESLEHPSQLQLSPIFSVPSPSRPSIPSAEEIEKPEPVLIQLVPNDVTPTIEQPPRQLTSNDALSTHPPPSALKKRAGKMSSDSPTQSNDGRSYEQYSDNNSQLQSSSQASSVHEHRTLYEETLHEEDTGYLNFKRTQDDILEPVPEDGQVKFANDLSKKSQLASQAPGSNGHEAEAPQTPAIAQRLFQHGGNGTHIMAPSQLFGQTQWTSAVKKASPTSSRPSPDVFNQNTLSPNPIISSPLKNRGLRTSPTHPFSSSPAFPGISSRPLDSKTPSVPTNSHEDEGVDQDSVEKTVVPRFEAPKLKKVLEPISEYKSWRKQSLERDAAKNPSQSGEEQDSESEVDAAAYRRRLARLKQEKASKSFPAISLPRSSSTKGDNVEVPSTSRTRSLQNPERTTSEEYLAQCYGKTSTDNNESQETVADSQEAPPEPQRPGTIPKASDDSTERNIDDAEDFRSANLPGSRAPAYNVEYRETIPETSPPGTSMEPPKLLGDIMRLYSSARSEEAMSFPDLSSGTVPDQQLKASNNRRSSSLPEPRSSVPTVRKEQSNQDRPSLESSLSIVLASSPQSAIRRSARLGNVVTPSSAGHDPPLPSDPGTRTSTLSSLSATPNMSSSITPNTEPDRLMKAIERRSSSPAAVNIQRRGRPTSSIPRPPSSLPQITTSSRSRESTRRTTRHSSVSTDELARPLFAISDEELKPPSRKPARRSSVNQRRGSTLRTGIFEGMVFALSFQEGQARKNKEKQGDKATIERMIRQEGGKILSDGFHKLFKFDSFHTSVNSSASHTLSSSLTLFDEDIGFTALIADGHSRKVKYMQALALGIPCLAPQWIMNCISKKEIVDWSSYLLCAGPSALLGEAIRSRNLQPYDASTAKLADVISNRPKLLDKARILLVMKKSKNEARKLEYVFLAQVLGSSLVRVYSLEEARAKLREEESHDRPFDWVYVDDNLKDPQKALFGTTAGNGASKKRKRQSTETDESDQPPKKIRTLSHELVIQSLILGRLIEEGEMEE
ncbi:hypothetical protein F5Y05DRAFT_46817 [Hypoxylon sp. FL0543]|nr:hypothetical protein F5Y05DRAFT_46817 [Hypoxylon sp. FL0543]